MSAMSCSLKIQGVTSLIQSLGRAISEIRGSGTEFFFEKMTYSIPKDADLILIIFYKRTIFQKWSQQKLQAMSYNPQVTSEFFYFLEKSIIDSVRTKIRSGDPKTICRICWRAGATLAYGLSYTMINLSFLVINIDCADVNST